MKLDIYGLIGENCITLEDGQKIYDRIHPELLAGHPVELDFAKVDVYAQPFFNAAIGQLLKDIKTEGLNRLLKICNLVPAGRAVLKRVIENSKQCYSDENFRKVQDEVLLEQTKNLWLF